MIYFNSLGKYGGFGNQLFQYAVAYVHAKRFQTEVCTTPHKSYYHEGYKMWSHFIADYIDLPLKISTDHTPKSEFNESNFLYVSLSFLRSITISTILPCIADTSLLCCFGSD